MEGTTPKDGLLQAIVNDYKTLFSKYVPDRLDKSP